MQYRISTEPGARLRIDKWLWAARFFKTRSLAADAVDKGRVEINGDHVKTSKEVRVGDLVTIEIERLRWVVEVRGICDVRGPASVAQTLYAETEGSIAARRTELERRKVFHEPAAERHGRPTKRERRVIDRFSGEG